MPNSDAAVHDKQALVLVNYGAATGDGFLNYHDRPQTSVHEHFGVALETEVNIC